MAVRVQLALEVEIVDAAVEDYFEIGRCFPWQEAELSVSPMRSNEEMMDGWLEYVLPETSPTERASVR